MTTTGQVFKEILACSVSRRVIVIAIVVSVAEWLRRRVGTRKVPSSNAVVGTAYTCSHQPTQLSILSGSVNEYPGYSF